MNERAGLRTREKKKQKEKRTHEGGGGSKIAAREIKAEIKAERAEGGKEGVGGMEL